MYQTKAYSAASKTSPLAESNIPRRDVTERDVQIDILYCGICHSDLHYARDEWHDAMPAVYPCVPGHEIIARSPRLARRPASTKLAILSALGAWLILIILVQLQGRT